MISTGQGLLSTNMFAYCENNPVVRSDSSGHFWWIIAGAVIGAVVGATTQIVSNVMTGQDWTTDLVGAALGGAVTGAILAASCGTAWVAASFAGAAVTSVSNEVESYVRKKKPVTKANVAQSVKNVAVSTAVSETVNCIGSGLAGMRVPTQASWIVPKKIVSSFTGNYAQKVWTQTAIGGLTNTISNFLQGEYQKEKRARQTSSETISWDLSTSIRAAN